MEEEQGINLNLSLQPLTVPRRRSKRLLIKEKKQIVIYYDFETTGLNPYHSQLLECAFVFETTPPISSFVKCLSPIPDIVKKITGITEEHVRGAPELSSVLSELLTRVYELSPYRIVWVAHNNYGFDEFFWNRYFGRYFDFCENIHLDSMRLAQMLLPDMYSYKLTSIASFLKISITGTAHRALYDTMLLQKITEKLGELYETLQHVNLFEHPEHCSRRLHMV
jgi:DNA polymerase III alpha subunit (gram-positive type)